MPVITSFNGISIRMYFQQSEHNPPHIHAYYGDYIVAVAIKTLEVIEGDFPPKKLSLVRKWITDNEEDLLRMWENQEFKKL